MRYFAKFKEDGRRDTSIVEGVHFKRIKNPIYNTEAIVTVIGQDPETGEDITQTAEPGIVITGYAPDTFEPPIPEGFVEITDEDQALYVTNKYIRGADGKPELRPVYEPTEQEKQDSALRALNTQYADLLAQLERTAGKAPLLRRAGMLTEEQETLILDNLAAQYAEVSQELRQKQNEIVGGN